ncbi:hypothetical protein CL176_08695 [Suicoccus acidiformans]|uniref:Uncharacterized protein n=1 Tax=Suicoccus acidiformans TaxID=2036206 RepID=A0A347WLW3_9LACT|nr:hypothetical protein CL176_08695 [Suicoccus acidiformans]
MLYANIHWNWHFNILSFKGVIEAILHNHPVLTEFSNGTEVLNIDSKAIGIEFCANFGLTIVFMVF